MRSSDYEGQNWVSTSYGDNGDLEDKPCRRSLNRNPGNLSTMRAYSYSSKKADNQSQTPPPSAFAPKTLTTSSNSAAKCVQGRDSVRAVLESQHDGG